MARIITVTADGLHLRPSLPDGSVSVNGQPIDTLSKGDQLVWLKTSKDGQWYYGRVAVIRSGRFLADRIGREAWVWAASTELSAEAVPQSRPPAWAAAAIAVGAVVFAVVAYLALGGK